MGDVGARVALAVAVAVVLALVLARIRGVPRDIGLTAYAVIVAVVGIFAWLGPLPAVIGGAIIAGVVALGALIYLGLTVAERWAERHS